MTATAYAYHTATHPHRRIAREQGNVAKHTLQLPTTAADLDRVRLLQQAIGGGLTPETVASAVIKYMLRDLKDPAVEPGMFLNRMPRGETAPPETAITVQLGDADLEMLAVFSHYYGGWIPDRVLGLMLLRNGLDYAGTGPEEEDGEDSLKNILAHLPYLPEEN